ncbi:hypothetical protein E9840_12065 [Tissierella creatinini]|nr:hypothetical protein E9840_12065 [Tissierella creatinini]TJX60400.1 hypothetical protein E8P77_20230 [Soehngenia saccharolytica]
MLRQRPKLDYTPVGDLKDIITQYINYKRSLGFIYEIEEGVLFRFSLLSKDYELSKQEIPLALIDAWCMRRISEKSSTHNTRVNTILQFCRYAENYGFRIDYPEIPKIKVNKYQPYIFTKEEISGIFKTADSTEPYPGSLRHIQVPILYRLIYSCGLRATETANIKCRDVDLVNNIISIYEAKFSKERLVPFSDSMGEILKEYIHRFRKDAHPNDYLFPTKYSNHITRSNIYKWFRIILKMSGISHLGLGNGPREHDLRHTFCVHTLQYMQETGMDIYASLPLLSVYIGHTSIKETQHYLRLTSEFYPEILDMLENSGCDIIP